MNNLTDFANFTCKLLYYKHNGQFQSTYLIDDATLLRKYFESHTRNVYELLKDIPLFLYVDYLTLYFHDGDIYSDKYEGWSKDEILDDIEEICHLKYA